MYTFVFVIFSNIVYCSCTAEYEMFPGFDSLNPTSNATDTKIDVAIKSLNLNTTDHSSNTTAKPIMTMNLTTDAPFACPEEDHPSNIGPYEVPTQRDLVLLIRKTLADMFKSYHEKALFLLKDIKEATRATSETEKKCQGNKYNYRKCVKQVSIQCEFITKNIVTSLEKQRQDVATFDKICNVSAMKADPLKLVKTLAMEEASLEFGLPGFLRLLDSCSFHCTSVHPKGVLKKPARHMTDQDLVIRHFLTKKDYIQLIKV